MIVVHKNTDITEYVSSMSWGGSRTEVARKLELHIVNAPLDKNITPLTINLADPVYLFEDDGKTELFRGYVVEREASSTSVLRHRCFYMEQNSEMQQTSLRCLAASMWSHFYLYILSWQWQSL